MESLWNDQEAQKYADSPLHQRVYTSRLLGQEPALVLHGGGNTSVKTEVANIFGDMEPILYVKGSGWDLATIEASGFAPVRLNVLQRMAQLEQMSDLEMVTAQRAAMIDPNAPNPSVEAILHALIPFKYVDHTHADALLTITNSKNGEALIRKIYGDRILLVPYVMPGFLLAKKIYEMTRDLDWSSIEGIILMNHGIFTFHDDVKTSYERMIFFASEAEAYLFKHGAWNLGKDASNDTQQNETASEEPPQPKYQYSEENLLKLATLRKTVSSLRGRPVLATTNTTQEALDYSMLPALQTVSQKGLMTPDHVIWTKSTPVILGETPISDVQNFADTYQRYFETHNPGNLTSLDLAPRVAIWPQHGTVAFGETIKEAQIISDMTEHTARAIQRAELLGGWQAPSEKDIFDVEYWELEQAKLKLDRPHLEFEGKVALVTGAASGIGKACAEALHERGAVVVVLDINPVIQEIYNKPDYTGIVCDLTNPDSLNNAISETVQRFGGIDILVSNAGIFPKSHTIEAMPTDTWDKSMAINLTSHQRLIQACAPYLKQGIDPSIVIIASKNVPAPGPGASAYSVAKAGLTQLARIAAMELGPAGIRVNAIHPNQVFDTALWTDEILEKRAAHYKMSVAEYKTNNLLKAEIKSKDVARLACAMAGDVFSKTTGSQVPIDGGNDRVI